MKVRLPLILALSPIAMAAAAPVAAQSAAPADDFAQVKSFMAGIDTMTARFTQTDRNGKVVSGTITLKRPGKVRFQY